MPTTTVLGTSAYMAPEAFRGDVSVKLDTFSFGVVSLPCLANILVYLVYNCFGLFLCTCFWRRLVLHYSHYCPLISACDVIMQDKINWHHVHSKWKLWKNFKLCIPWWDSRPLGCELFLDCYNQMLAATHSSEMPVTIVIRHGVMCQGLNLSVLITFWLLWCSSNWSMKAVCSFHPMTWY